MTPVSRAPQVPPSVTAVRVPSLQSYSSLRPVAGCPHTRLTAWESWPGFDLKIATCQDCGTTISREAA